MWLYFSTPSLKDVAFELSTDQCSKWHLNCFLTQFLEKPNFCDEIIYHNMTVLPVHSSPPALTVKPHESTTGLRFESNS